MYCHNTPWPGPFQQVIELTNAFPITCSEKAALPLGKAKGDQIAWRDLCPSFAFNKKFRGSALNNHEDDFAKVFS